MVIEYNDPAYIFYVVTQFLILEIFLIFGLFLIKLFISLNKERSSKQRDYMPLLVGLYFICSFFTRILYNIHDYLLEFGSKNETPLTLMLFRIGILILFSGFGFIFIFLHQKVIKGRDKYLLIIFFFVLVIISIFMPDAESISIISLIIVIFVIPLTFAYLYISVKSKGMVRTKALYIFFGAWVTFIGMAISVAVHDLGGWFIIIGISSIIIIIGSVLVFQGFKILLPADINVLDISKTPLAESLGLTHTRPEKITEEEVSISKEKKICLVCKGKAKGMTYICTECEAFYCVKCAQAISNLENACWACDEPIDKSKPVKPFKREEEIEEIEISEKPQKKPKTKK